MVAGVDASQRSLGAPWTGMCKQVPAAVMAHVGGWRDATQVPSRRRTAALPTCVPGCREREGIGVMAHDPSFWSADHNYDSSIGSAVKAVGPRV